MNGWTPNRKLARNAVVGSEGRVLSLVGYTEVIAKNDALSHRQLPSGCGHDATIFFLFRFTCSHSSADTAPIFAVQ